MATQPVYVSRWNQLIEVPTGVKPAVVHITRSDDGFTYNVALTNIGMRSKTFKGETAWSDALRYASDAAAHVGTIWYPEDR